MVMEASRPDATWETCLVSYRVPGECIYVGLVGLASEYRPATWDEVAAAGLYVPPEVEAYEALCAVARVAADLWSCGACCDCSGCKKRNTLTAVFMRLEAAGVEVPKIHPEVEG